jgi:hypothetical protein
VFLISDKISAAGSGGAEDGADPGPFFEEIAILVGDDAADNDEDMAVASGSPMTGARRSPGSRFR